MNRAEKGAYSNSWVEENVDTSTVRKGSSYIHAENLIVEAILREIMGVKEEEIER